MLSFFELYNLLEAKRKKDSEEIPTPTPTPTDSTEGSASETLPPTLPKKLRANLTPATIAPTVSEDPDVVAMKNRFSKLLNPETPRTAYGDKIKKIIDLFSKGLITKLQAEKNIDQAQKEHGIGIVRNRDTVYYVNGERVNRATFDAAPEGNKEARSVSSVDPPKVIDPSQVRSTSGQGGSGPSEASRRAWIAARHNLEKEIDKVLGEVLGIDEVGNVKRTNNKKKIDSAIKKVLANQDVQNSLNAFNNLASDAGEKQWSISDEEGIDMLKSMITPFNDTDPFADGDEDADVANDPHAGMSWHPYRRDKETGKMGTYVPNDEIEEYYGDQETINSRPKQSTKKLTQYQQRKIADGILGFNNVLKNAAWRELTKQAALSLDLPYKFPENTAEHSFVFRLNTPDPQDKLNNQIVITLKDFKDLYYEIRKSTGLQSEFEKRRDELYNQRRAGLINDEELRSQLSDARKTLSKKHQSMKRESNLAMALAYEGQKNPQYLATSIRAMRFSNHLEDGDIVGKTFTVKSLAEILARKAPSGGLETQPKEEENIDAVEMIIRVSSIKFRNLGKIDTVGRRGRQGLKMRFAKKNRQIGLPGRDPSKEYTGISDTKGAEQEQLVQTSFNIFKILDGTKISQLSPSTKIYVNKKDERTDVESAQDNTGRFAGTGGGEARVHGRYSSMTDDVAPGVEEEKAARAAARAAERRRRRQEQKDRAAGGPLGQRGRGTRGRGTRGRGTRKESAADRLMRLISPPDKTTEESTNWLDIVDLMNYWNKKQ